MPGGVGPISTANLFNTDDIDFELLLRADAIGTRILRRWQSGELGKLDPGREADRPARDAATQGKA